MKRERFIRPLALVCSLLLGAVGLAGCTSQPGVAAEFQDITVTEASVDQAMASLMGSKVQIDEMQQRDRVAQSLFALKLFEADRLKGLPIETKTFSSNGTFRTITLESLDEQYKATKQQIDNDPTMEAAAKDLNLQKLNEDYEARVKQVKEIDDDSLDILRGQNLWVQINDPKVAPLVKDKVGDLSHALSPRYGIVTEQGIAPNVPSSVFIIPVQQEQQIQ